MSRLKRGHVALLLLLAMAALIGADLWASQPVDPFAAPAVTALGSGRAASGGFCAAPAK
jgi:hypothetical protein